MPYFDTVTDRSVLSRWPLPPSKHINKAATLPAASSWSTDQLRAARLVVRSATARSESEPNHILPDLREHFGEAETACSQPLIRSLLQGPSEASLSGTLTETELVHQYGASLASFWDALAQFGDVEGLDVEGGDLDGDADEGDKRPYSPRSDSFLPHKRTRTQVVNPVYDNSSTMRVGSSSPSREGSSPQASQGSDPGYVSQGRATADVPEHATVRIASAFLRHLLQSCPPQHETQHYKPPYLVEFSGGSRRFVGKTAYDVAIGATADGELVLHQLRNGRYNLTGHHPALLEAKKRFAVIKDGLPALTDKFLGQMTCEALAFRLQQKQTEGAVPIDEKCDTPSETICVFGTNRVSSHQCLCHCRGAAIHALFAIQDLRLIHRGPDHCRRQRTRDGRYLGTLDDGVVRPPEPWWALRCGP